MEKALSVREVANQLSDILERKDVEFTEEKMSLYDLKRVLTERLKFYNISGREKELLKLFNKRSFGKKCGAFKISNLELRGFNDTKTAKLELSFVKKNIENLDICYDEEDKAYVVRKDVHHMPTLEYIKNNFHKEINDNFLNVMACVEELSGYYQDDTMYIFPMNFVSRKFTGTDIEGLIVNEEGDCYSGLIELPKMSKEIIHLMPEFDVYDIVSKETDTLLKKQSVVISELDKGYQNAVKSYIKK